MLFGGGGGEALVFGGGEVVGWVISISCASSAPQNTLPVLSARAGRAVSALIRNQNFSVKRSWGWDHVRRSCWSTWSGKHCLTHPTGSLGLVQRGAGWCRMVIPELVLDNWVICPIPLVCAGWSFPRDAQDMCGASAPTARVLLQPLLSSHTHLGERQWLLQTTG